MRTAAVVALGHLRDPDPEARGRIEVIDLPERELGAEEVRVRVAYAAICGSDPHVSEGQFGTDLPLGLGHEVSGVVEALGSAATRTDLRIGDRVAGNFVRFCGSCNPCRTGRQQFCRHIAESIRPGMAETVTWHESQIHRLPDGVSLRDGCLLEPTSVALRIADKTRIRPGDRVVISGGGPIGQLTLQIMARYGATSLTMIEPNPARRALALRHGARHVIDPIAEDTGGRAQAITDGDGFDVVIDASGSRAAAEGLLDIAALGGMVIYGAVYPDDFALPLKLSEYLYRRELTLTGVLISPYSFPRAVNLLTELDVSELTQTVFDLTDVAAAFEAHLGGVHPKVLVRPNDIPDFS